MRPNGLLGQLGTVPRARMRLRLALLAIGLSIAAVGRIARVAACRARLSRFAVTDMRARRGRAALHLLRLLVGFVVAAVIRDVKLLGRSFGSGLARRELQLRLESRDLGLCPGSSDPRSLRARLGGASVRLARRGHLDFRPCAAVVECERAHRSVRRNAAMDVAARGSAMLDGHFVAVLHCRENISLECHGERRTRTHGSSRESPVGVLLASRRACPGQAGHASTPSVNS